MIEVVSAAPQGVSHTCWGDNVHHYSIPVKPKEVLSRAHLILEFGPLQARHQTLKLASLKNTFKSN